jgi:glycosyltransferase involved in cell wall biosynthesis
MPKELKSRSYEYEKPTLHVPARLIRVKGHRILIEAIALLPFEQRPEVFLYGDGPCRKELEAKVVFEGVKEHFKFFGQVNRNFIFEIYGKSRFPIVVLPSLELPRNQHEGIPFALIEAMSMSIPVISTNSGSIPELLQDFQEFLVAPGNVSELRSAIHRLTNNLDLYTELSIKSKMVIEKNFNASVTASKFQDLCK